MTKDIERYLNKEMPTAEREAFEAAMAKDPDLANEVADYRAMLEHLRTQLLREKMMKALNAAPPSKRPFFRRKGLWSVGISFLLGILAIGYFLVKQRPVSSGQTPSPLGTDSVEHIPDLLPEKKSPASETAPESIPGPIAQTTEEGVTKGLPRVRGADPSASAEPQPLASWLEGLQPIPGPFPAAFEEAARYIHAGEFSEAYVALQLLSRRASPNDTLLLLKAFCLLELGEGTAALHQLGQLSPQHSWPYEADWYRTLALLVQGSTEEAFQSARTIQNTPGHPFREQAAALRKSME